MKKIICWIFCTFLFVHFQTSAQTTIINPIDSTQTCVPTPGICLPDTCFPNDDGSDDGGGFSEIPCTGFLCGLEPNPINPIDDGGTCEGSDCGDNSCSATTNVAANSSGAQSTATTNPINLISGNKYKRQEDIATLPGVLGLEFVRHYNSAIPGNSGIGLGWRHSYSIALSVREGFKPGEMELLKIQQSDGRIIRFNRIGDRKDETQYATRNNADGFIVTSQTGYKWYWRNGRIFTFDDRGWLREISEGSNVLNLQYSTGGQLLSVVDPQNRRLTFAYNKGLMTKVVDPKGSITRFKYASGRQLLYVERPSGKTRFYHYEDKDRVANLTGITDERGIRVESYRYDDQGRGIVSTKGTDIDKVEIQYEPNQRIVTNGLGESTTYILERINGQQVVKEIIGPGCSACSGSDVVYQYNNALQVTQKSHKNGLKEFYEYDERQRKTAYYRQDLGQKEKQLVEAYGYRDNKPWPTQIKRQSIAQGKFHTIELYYNEFGKILKMEESGFAPITPLDIADVENHSQSYRAIHRTSTLEYNDRSQLTKIDGPREDVDDHILVKYNENGYLKSFTLANGISQNILAYDANGRPIKIQKGSQTPLEISYTSFGKPASISQGVMRVEYTYNEIGQLISITDSDGLVTNLSYDDSSRLSKYSKENGPRLEVDYDIESRVSQRRVINQKDIALDTISYFYDAQNRLAKTEENKNNIENEYDEYGRLSEVKTNNIPVKLSDSPVENILRIVQASGVSMDYYQDNQNNIVGAKDYNGNITRPIKDDFNRIVINKSADASETYYSYDSASNVTAIKLASGKKTSYEYDAANRLITHTTPDGRSEYRYDSINGQLKSVSNETIYEEFIYDQNARMVEHKRIIDDHEFKTNYQYNQFNKLISKVLPNGKKLYYEYHTQGTNKGKLKNVLQDAFFGFSETPLFTDIDNNKWDGETSFTYENGLKTIQSYNDQGRVNQISTDGLLDFNYEYDRQGNVENLKIAAEQQAINERYEYGNGHIQGIYSGEYEQDFTGYSYDKVGNRLSETKATIGEDQPRSALQRLKETGSTDQHIKFDLSLYEYDHQSNRLNAVIDKKERKEYQYNEQGSPTKIAYTVYEYNSAQRPVKVYIGGELVVEYAYNAWGERVLKTAYKDGVKKYTYYLYEQNRLLAEANDKGKIIRQYYYNKDQVIGMWHKKSFYAVHVDNVGKPYQVTNQDKQTVWLANYSVFGKATTNTDPDQDGKIFEMPLRLPGQIEDAETGMYYNYHRDYDPLTGRYLTSDPLGFAGGINSYLYAQANPLRYTDPLGLQAVDEFGNEVINGFIVASFSSDGCSPNGDSELANLQSAINELGVVQGADFLAGTPVVLFAGTSGELIHNHLNGALVQNNPMIPTIGGAGDISTFNPDVNTGNLNFRNASLTDDELEAAGNLFSQVAPPSVEVMFMGPGSMGQLLLDRPAHNEGLVISISGNSSFEQVKEVLTNTLGNLITDEDVQALLDSLPEGMGADSVYAVNLGPLFNEIIARFQTRLHSDPVIVDADFEVFSAELEFQQANENLQAVLAENGFTAVPFRCTTAQGGNNLRPPCPEINAARRLVNDAEDAFEDAHEAYIEALADVTTELIETGFFPAIQAITDENNADLELLNEVSLAIVGIFVPLTLTDAAIDISTAGLGRIPRVGRALNRIYDAVRAGTRVLSRPIRNAAEAVASRINAVRYSRIINAFPNIGNNPNLLRYVDGSGLDDAALRRLDDDLVANPELARVLDENPLRLEIRNDLISRGADDLARSPEALRALTGISDDVSEELIKLLDDPVTLGRIQNNPNLLVGWRRVTDDYLQWQRANSGNLQSYLGVAESRGFSFDEIHDFASARNFRNETGDVLWPPNDGFVGEPVSMFLEPNTILTRYSRAPNAASDGGSFVSPAGIPAPQRALAPGTVDEAGFYTYIVNDRIEVQAGEIARWFDQPGGGTQFLFGSSISDLVPPVGSSLPTPLSVLSVVRP